MTGDTFFGVLGGSLVLVSVCLAFDGACSLLMTDTGSLVPSELEVLVVRPVKRDLVEVHFFAMLFFFSATIEDAESVLAAGLIVASVALLAPTPSLAELVLVVAGELLAAAALVLVGLANRSLCFCLF